MGTTYGSDGVLVIDCAECALEHTEACEDCVVTWLVERDPGAAVVIDAAEVRALRALEAGGLVPTLRHSPRQRFPGAFTLTSGFPGQRPREWYGPNVPVPHLDDPAAYRDLLLALGLDAGLDAVGVTEAVAWPDARRRLEERKAAGLHGGMAFTYRDPARATDPRRSLPDARTLLVGARSYRRRPPTAAADAAPIGDGPTGRIARYAWVDHGEHLRVALKAVAGRLKSDGWRARVLIDDNGLVDREAAHRAGLGWFGKNANLLLPGRGSWFVLGAVLTSAPLPVDATPVPDGCSGCRRCLDGCPTGAIVAPGVVDARRCLSWLLQIDGEFPREHREALGDRLYGCDDCQEVCPPNRRADDEHPPPMAEAGAVAEVAVLDLLAAADRTLLDRHGRWYVPRRDPDHLRRNALVVLGNTADPGDLHAVAILDRYLDHPNPVLRSHAAWACRRLGRADRLVGREADEAVAAELAAPAPAARH